MTYYEFVKLLKELSDISRDDDIYNRIINADLKLYTDMRYRFVLQVMDFISKKMHVCFDRFLTLINNENINLDDFVIIVNDLKHELDYISSFKKIKCLPVELSNDVDGLIIKLINVYNDISIKLINNNYDLRYLDEYNNIINDYIKSESEVNR